jgi:hypothetical protein
MGCSQSKDGNSPGKQREPSAVVTDQKIAKGAKNAAHHVKNVFATPFDAKELNAFKTAQHPKAKGDEELILKALKSNFVFEHLSPRETQPLILAFEEQEIIKDEEIIKQGDQGEYFYIIKGGSVVFFVDGKEVGKAPAGSSFGELALLCKSFTMFNLCICNDDFVSIYIPISQIIVQELQQLSPRRILSCFGSTKRHSDSSYKSKQ